MIVHVRLGKKFLLKITAADWGLPVLTKAGATLTVEIFTTLCDAFETKGSTPSVYTQILVASDSRSHRFYFVGIKLFNISMACQVGHKPSLAH